MWLQGTKGYFRGSTELNNVCKALYSNSSLGITARNMTIEDINKACNYIPSVTSARYAYYPFGTTFVEGDTTIEYNGNMYTKAAHNKNTAKFYISDGGGIEDTDVDGFKYKKPEIDNPVYVTQTYYDYNPTVKSSIIGMMLDSSDGWLASPCVDPSSNYANFRMFTVSSSYIHANTLCYSTGSTSSKSNGIVPLIALDSTLQIDTDDTIRDGSTPAKAWKLIKK